MKHYRDMARCESGGRYFTALQLLQWTKCAAEKLLRSKGGRQFEIHNRVLVLDVCPGGQNATATVQLELQLRVCSLLGCMCVLH